MLGNLFRDKISDPGRAFFFGFDRLEDPISATLPIKSLSPVLNVLKPGLAQNIGYFGQAPESPVIGEHFVASLLSVSLKMEVTFDLVRDGVKAFDFPPIGKRLVIIPPAVNMRHQIVGTTKGIKYKYAIFRERFSAGGEVFFE